MRAVDTNVLVRLVTRDDAQQVKAAEAFVAKGAWVPHLALVEAVWVLTAVYALKGREVAGIAPWRSDREADGSSRVRSRRPSTCS